MKINQLYSLPYHTGDISQLSFLITGGAGFIGSNIVTYLLLHGAGHVRVLDNFSNGYRDNISNFLKFSNFELMEGDIRDYETCQAAVKGIDFVSHQAALGSVPRSIKNPLLSNDVNVSGFLNMIEAAKNEKSIKRFVYAASSSTYGDNYDLPKRENKIGNPLSPYAVTKYVNELYANVYSKVYNFHSIGLRYFNVFGPNQSPDNPYAAVIPLFIKSALNKKPPTINGDGTISRDFTFVANAVQANIKAFFNSSSIQNHEVYNVACGSKTSLIDLWEIICDATRMKIQPEFGPQRVGDIITSLADISKATKDINYKPVINVRDGIRLTIETQYE